MSRQLSRTCAHSLVAGSFVARSFTSSIPRSKPLPRTSPVRSYFAFKRSSPAKIWFPIFRAFACNFSRSITSRTAAPCAHTTGLPPKVLKCIRCVIFAVGLVGASLLAAAVLPLATSYAVSEAFGFSKGVGLDFRRAPLFFTLFTGLIIFGAGAALIPSLPVIKLLVLIQVLNGVLLPIFLVFILLLINDQRLTKELKNTRFYNIL